MVPLVTAVVRWQHRRRSVNLHDSKLLSGDSHESQHKTWASRAVRALLLGVELLVLTRWVVHCVKGARLEPRRHKHRVLQLATLLHDLSS